MTTTIIVSQPVTKAVNPKPTKREIIEALVRLKMQQAREAKEEAQKEEEALQAELEESFRTLALKNHSKYRVSSYFGWRHDEDCDGCYVSFHFGKLLPEAMKKKIKKMNELNRVFVPDEKRTRKMIQQSIDLNGTTEERVQALIDSPEANAALKKMLEDLGV